MREETLRQVVAEWLEASAPADLVRRQIEAPDLAELKQVLAVVGPRRAGKTYFMHQMIADLTGRGAGSREDVLFIDFEDYRLLGFSADDVPALFAAFRHLTGRDPTYLFLDEVQRLAHWSRIVRTLHNARRYRIVVSGSTSGLLDREVAMELRGRYRDLVVLPFSLGELLSLRKVPLTGRTPYTSRKGDVLRIMDEYLASGGFPEVATLDAPAERRRLLASYFQTVFYRDIVERYNVRAKHILDAMMRYCVDEYGKTFSISKFATRMGEADMPGSKRTIANYLRYLADAFFLLVNEKFSLSARTRIMNPKKAYLLDPGFAALGAALSENRGALLENAVAIELRRREAQMFYFAGRGECDFVLVEGQKPAHALQVCWELNADNRERELAGLREAMASLKIARGTILTYDTEAEIDDAGRKIAIEPAWRWLLEQ